MNVLETSELGKFFLIRSYKHVPIGSQWVRLGTRSNILPKPGKITGSEQSLTNLMLIWHLFGAELFLMKSQMPLIWIYNKEIHMSTWKEASLMLSVVSPPLKVM